MQDNTLHVALTPASVTALDAALRRLVGEFGHSLPKAVERAAKYVTRSIAAQTKIAKTPAKVEARYITVERYSQKTGKLMSGTRQQAVWGVNRWNHRTRREEWQVLKNYPQNATEAKKSWYAQIQYSGLAKMSWWWVGKKIGGSGGRQCGERAAQKRAMKFSDVEKNLNKKSPSINLSVSLEYAVDALKGGEASVNLAVQKASRAMFKELERKAATI